MTGGNHSRRRPEEALHRAAAQFLDLALPEDAFWFHPPNGGARSKAEGGIFKALGVKPGVPDLCVIYGGVFHGIELKAGSGKLTIRQELAHENLRNAGARVTICRSLPEIEGWLCMYMPLKARAA